MARVESAYDLSTPQGVYDHVATKLLEQGKAAVGAGGQCRYLVPADGCRCAVGHLLDGDPDILPKLNGSIANDEVWQYLDERIEPSGHNTYGLLCDLQGAHDYAAGSARATRSDASKPRSDVESAAFLSAFRMRMTQVAIDHALSSMAVS